MQSLNDKKVAIIGYGSIGKTVARNLSGFDDHRCTLFSLGKRRRSKNC